MVLGGALSTVPSNKLKIMPTELCTSKPKFLTLRAFWTHFVTFAEKNSSA